MPREFLASLTVTSGQVVGGLFAPLEASDLPVSGVTPNSYSNPTLTVDAYGRITSIVGGSSGIAIGAGVAGANNDNSILYVDSAGHLAQAAAGTLWFNPAATAGFGTGKGLFIGGLDVGDLTDQGALFMYDPTNGTYRYIAQDDNQWTFQGNLSLTGQIFAGTVTCNDMSVQTGGGQGIFVQAGSTQTADLQRWIGFPSTIYSRVNKDGYFITAKHAAPADADLATGDLAIWFDQTIGSSKLMLKGKNSAGTVVTGSVSLT